MSVIEGQIELGSGFRAASIKFDITTCNQCPMQRHAGCCSATQVFLDEINPAEEIPDWCPMHRGPIEIGLKE